MSNRIFVVLSTGVNGHPQVHGPFTARKDAQREFDSLLNRYPKFDRVVARAQWLRIQELRLSADAPEQVYVIALDDSDDTSLKAFGPFNSEAAADAKFADILKSYEPDPDDDDGEDSGYPDQFLQVFTLENPYVAAMA